MLNSPPGALASSSLLVLATFALSCVLSAAAAPFSSWAGKRSSSSLADNGGEVAPLTAPEIRQLIYDLSNAYHTLQSREGADDYSPPLPGQIPHLSKRAPFSSWAGKRAPFSSWAGKRAPFSSWAGKRAPFSSWAGKRSAPSMEAGEEEDEQPMMMESHRYKRSSGEAEDTEGVQVRERRGAQFSAWGGKRRRRSPNERSLVPVRVLRPSRAAFSAWGGKR